MNCNIILFSLCRIHCKISDLSVLKTDRGITKTSKAIKKFIQKREGEATIHFGCLTFSFAYKLIGHINVKLKGKISSNNLSRYIKSFRLLLT